MQHFDIPDPNRMFRAAVITSLTFLALIITFFALTAHQEDQGQVTPLPHGPAAAPHLADNLNVVEQNIPLSDGRTVTCLVFAPSNRQQPSCDWATARRMP